MSGSAAPCRCSRVPRRARRPARALRRPRRPSPPSRRRAPRATRASSRPRTSKARSARVTGAPAQDADAPARGTEGYTNIFAPQNLERQVGVGDGAQAPDPDAPAKGTEGYTNIFAPQNLEEPGRRRFRRVGQEERIAEFDPHSAWRTVRSRSRSTTVCRTRPATEHPPMSSPDDHHRRVSETRLRAAPGLVHASGRSRTPPTRLRGWADAMEALGDDAETDHFARGVREAIDDQVRAGIDIPTDGEIARENYIHYHCRHLDGRELRDGWRRRRCATTQLPRASFPTIVGTGARRRAVFFPPTIGVPRHAPTGQ